MSSIVEIFVVSDGNNYNPLHPNAPFILSSLSELSSNVRIITEPKPTRSRKKPIWYSRYAYEIMEPQPELGENDRVFDVIFLDHPGSIIPHLSIDVLNVYPRKFKGGNEEFGFPVGIFPENNNPYWFSEEVITANSNAHHIVWAGRSIRTVLARKMLDILKQESYIPDFRRTIKDLWPIFLLDILDIPPFMFEQLIVKSLQNKYNRFRNVKSIIQQELLVHPSIAYQLTMYLYLVSAIQDPALNTIDVVMQDELKAVVAGDIEYTLPLHQFKALIQSPTFLDIKDLRSIISIKKKSRPDLLLVNCPVINLSNYAAITIYIKDFVCFRDEIIATGAYRDSLDNVHAAIFIAPLNTYMEAVQAAHNNWMKVVTLSPAKKRRYQHALFEKDDEPIPIFDLAIPDLDDAIKFILSDQMLLVSEIVTSRQILQLVPMPK